MNTIIAKDEQTLAIKSVAKSKDTERANALAELAVGMIF